MYNKNNEIFQKLGYEINKLYICDVTRAEIQLHLQHFRFYYICGQDSGAIFSILYFLFFCV